VVFRSRRLLPYPQGGTLGAGAQAFSAWINGRKRFQGGARAEIPVSRTTRQAEIQSVRHVSREEIEAIYKLANCRRTHWSLGLFVGRLHAVFEPDCADEDARAGRWRGRSKTECGIHTTKTS